VLSFLDLAKMKRKQPAALGPLFERIGEGLQEMDRVAAELLALSRPDPEPAGSAELAPIIERAWQFLRLRAEKHHVSLKCSVVPGLPPIQADPARIAEALLNIFKNSLDACPDGGTISVEARPHPGQPNMVEVLISDTGPGIPPAIRPRVFEPFFSTKPSGQGTGLGLAMVKRIIEGCGGYVEIVDATTGCTMGLGLPIASGKGVGAGQIGGVIA
jgi:signal transduction histidine kinase